MRLYPKEYGSLSFQGGNLAATVALGQGLSSLERFRLGSEPAGSAGLRLPGVKLDWLIKTGVWAGSCNLIEKIEIREPTPMACEEWGLGPPPECHAQG